MEIHAYPSLVFIQKLSIIAAPPPLFFLGQVTIELSSFGDPVHHAGRGRTRSFGADGGVSGAMADLYVVEPGQAGTVCEGGEGVGTEPLPDEVLSGDSSTEC